MKQFKITSSYIGRDREVEAYLRWINKESLITPAEEVELARRIREGGPGARQAKDKLIRANLRFVVSVAKQHQYQGLTLSDLISLGNIGLIRAVEKFDETRGFKFISYAVWWIRQSMMQGIAEQGRVVRLPLNQVGALNRIMKAMSSFEQANQRSPSFEELSAETGIPESKIKEVLNAAGKATSVDAPVSDGESGTMLDVMSNPDAPETDSSLEQESLSTDICNALSHLQERESEILKMFFGIGCKEMTLEEIGMRFDLTRERVRQIKERALRHLKGHSTRLHTHLG